MSKLRRLKFDDEVEGGNHDNVMALKSEQNRRLRKAIKKRRRLKSSIYSELPSAARALVRRACHGKKLVIWVALCLGCLQSPATASGPAFPNSVSSRHRVVVTHSRYGRRVYRNRYARRRAPRALRVVQVRDPFAQYNWYRPVYIDNRGRLRIR